MILLKIRHLGFAGEAGTEVEMPHQWVLTDILGVTSLHIKLCRTVPPGLTALADDVDGAMATLLGNHASVG
jgi:hypothetical protein